MHELIQKLREARAAIAADVQKMITEAREAVTAGTRASVAWDEPEQARYDGFMAELTRHDERIQDLIDLDTRERAAAESARTAPVQVVREARTYERGNYRTSYFRDLGLAHVGHDQAAAQRLAQHAREVEVELPRIREARFSELAAAAGFDRAQARMEMRGLSRIVGDGQEEQRAISRTDGAGGEFVPPLWLIEDFAEFARAGRVSADLCRAIPLPGGTDSINIPRITGGSAVAAQTADGAAVQSTDITTGSVVGPVNTYAGQQDMALQLLEQSPVIFDEIVFADLIADYNKKLDAAVLNGTGANGQHSGLLVVGSTNAVTYTDASPTVPELFPKGADGIQQIASNRFLPPNAHVMHPRRWFWQTAALDANNRPLVVPNSNYPFNALGVGLDVFAEGPVGTWHGLPVYIDANMPITLGGGAEDAIITARWLDILLFEGVLRTRALQEVLSNTLQVRLQVYAYSAFIGGRQPKAISKINGTGLTTPTF